MNLNEVLPDIGTVALIVFLIQAIKTAVPALQDVASAFVPFMALGLGILVTILVAVAGNDLSTSSTIAAAILQGLINGAAAMGTYSGARAVASP